MAKIKLFSGMDFSGKTTIVHKINEKLLNVFKIQKKFLTDIDTIDKVRKLDYWLPPEEWRPLLQKTIKTDIANYKSNELVLQDSLWIIKYIATKIEQNNIEDLEEISILENLLGMYPDMDSFYITASIEERIKRFKEREALGKEITGSDKLLLDTNKFERIEKHYKNIVLKRFPNTKIIDTTNKTPDEIVDYIMKDSDFLEDL